MRRQLITGVLLGLMFQLFAQEINFDHIGPSDGLSQISVLSIYQDELGYMWFGTAEGLNRYDGKDIEVMKSSENDTSKLESNIINTICGNDYGLLYLVCGYKHLMSYNLKSGTFEKLSKDCDDLVKGKKSVWYSANNQIFEISNQENESRLIYQVDRKYKVTRLYEGSNKRLFIGTDKGLCLLDDNKIFNNILPGNEITSIYEDNKKNVWAGTRENGVYKINWSGQIVHYTNNGQFQQSLSSNIIRDFCEDNFGQIWIATFLGLDKLTPETGLIHNYRPSGLKPTDLSHTSIYKLYKDTQGTIWIGTYYGGINYYNPEANFYTYYYPSLNNADNLSFPIVGKMTEDRSGNLWICTEGGGLNCLNRKTRKFRTFKSGGANSIAHNNLKCIYYNPTNDNLYIGTHLGGISIYNIKSGKFTNISSKNNSQFPNDIIENLIPHGNDLIVLTQKGLISLNMNSGTISPFFKDKVTEKKIGMDLPTSFLDEKENLWLAKTDGGIIRYNLITREMKVYLHDYVKEGSIGRHTISKIYENKNGRLLFGTMGSGLFEFLPESDQFRKFDQESDNLMSDYIYDITETNYGYIVLLTNKGVNLFDLDSKKNYYLDSSHGLPIEMINFGCGIYVAGNGEIFVGGTNGMASFYENQINITPKDYNLFFSDLIVNNKLVEPGDKTGILEFALPYDSKIKLKYNQTNVTIKFGTSNNIKANRSKYEYQLKGFDDKWYPVKGQSVQYSNLNPGSYNLTIREILPNGSSQKAKSIRLDIRVTPPFYASDFAYMIYFLLIAGAIWWIIQFNKSRVLLRTSLEYEIKENDHIKELNQAKLQFFTNISHEFRTPLTLIIGQIESLTGIENISPTIHNKLGKIYKNALHLRNLITELLDFRKQEQELLTLKVSNLNLVDFVKEVYSSFHDLSVSKKIDYSFFSVDKNIMMWFDPIQLQKVFYNLISNAFKYTPNYSSISVKIEKVSNTVRISVMDTGVGIDENDLPFVFDRFYQAKNHEHTEKGLSGTGIGLNLAKSIVELHHGTINAEKRPNAGTVFRVTLLLGSEHFSSKEMENQAESDVDFIKMSDLPGKEFLEDFTVEDGDVDSPDKKSTILIVEDNEEMLQFLKDIFTPIYEVHLAVDGAEGLEKVKKLQPDIVLSDVMMPRMSGKDMCIKLKTNFETSHIPVVLLTADSSEEMNLEGLMIGADDYITKPFNVKMLISRCNNLVVSRKRMQEKFSKQIDNMAISIATNKMDQELLDKATAVVMKHLDDYDFNVSTFAQEMALGRSKLYLKLKGIIGMTPNDFILNIRLKTAATLLTTENELNISDITYRLGFNTPRYFSKCFKDLFGLSPMNYRKQNNPAFANKDIDSEEEDLEDGEDS